MKLENNNKNIIKRITNSSLKSNKGRNIFVVLAIVLTTFMISSVFSIGVSFVNNYTTMNIRLAGSKSTVALPNPKAEQIKSIKELGIATSIGKEITVGEVVDNKVDDNKSKIFLKYYDEENWKNQITPAISNIEGNYPSKENEVMVSTKALEFLGNKNAKIGDSIKIPYVDVNKNKTEKEFILSGKYKAYAFVDDTGYLVVSEQFIKNNDFTIENHGMLTLSLKSRDKDVAPELLKSKVKLDKTQKFQYNYDTNSDSSEVSMITVSVIGMIGFFIVLSGYLLIYNIMYIAVTKDINFYGLIKTIGTSPKQIKKIVKGQALRLSMVGIPIGLAIGGVVSFVIVPMAMKTFSTGAYANAMPGNVSFNPIIFIGATLFSLITVSLSCRKPAKIASSISPTEALRYSGAKTKKQKKDRRSTNGGKIYKMAWHNVFRDKKRAILVFLSLFMGIITFLSVNTFINSLGVENYINRYVPNDFEIENVELAPQKIDNNFLKEIKNTEGVKSLSNIKISKLQLDYNEKLLLPAFKGGYERFGGEDKDELNNFIKQIKHDPSKLKTNVIGIDDATIEEFNNKNKVKIDVKAFKDGKLALVDSFFYDEKHKNLSGGDLTIRNKDNKNLTFNTKLFLNNVSTLPDSPGNELGIPTIYISSSTLQKLDNNAINYVLHINVDKNYDSKIKAKLNRFCESRNLFIESKTEQTKGFQENSMVMNILGGGMSIILIFIGLLNFINVMITGVNVRLKELAVMESIGMTKKQIKKMLTLEGLYYGGLTTLFISTIGVVIIYTIAELTTKIADYAEFVFPTVPLISLAVLIFAVCFVTPSVVYKYSSKRSVTERLREIEK